MKTHDIKQPPPIFNELASFRRQFVMTETLTVRDVLVGDTVVAHEFDLDRLYTGRQLYLTVTSVTHGPLWAVKMDWSLLGVSLLKYVNTLPTDDFKPTTFPETCVSAYACPPALTGRPSLKY